MTLNVAPPLYTAALTCARCDRLAVRAVQRSIHDSHAKDCTDAAEGDAVPTI
jgi:hypothetical protein